MNKNTKKAISPVLGIILLTGLTVVLASFASFILFDIGDSSVSINPNIDIEIIEQTDGEIDINIKQNENVDELYVTQNTEELGSNETSETGEFETYERISSSGETYTINESEEGSNYDSSQRFEVIVIVDNNQIVYTRF